MKRKMRETHIVCEREVKKGALLEREKRAHYRKVIVCSFSHFELL